MEIRADVELRSRVAGTTRLHDWVVVRDPVLGYQDLVVEGRRYRFSHEGSGIRGSELVRWLVFDDEDFVRNRMLARRGKRGIS